MPRPITEPGKGTYWRLDLSEGEGYKRPRIRKSRAQQDAEKRTSDNAKKSRGGEVSPQTASSAERNPPAALPVDEDANIDPKLKDEGHIVGETRRGSANKRRSPYPVRKTPSPVTRAAKQQYYRQLAFGQPSFPSPALGHTHLPFPQPSAASPAFTTSDSDEVFPRPAGRTSSESGRESRRGITYISDVGLPRARRVRRGSASQPGSLSPSDGDEGGRQRSRRGR